MSSDNVYRQMLESSGATATFPHGVSMRPLIRQGSGYVSVVRADNPRPGDLLLFIHRRAAGNVNLLHRLVKIRPDGTYVCRGDNCLNCELIRRADIIGRADSIFWTRKASPLMPRLLGARTDAANGGWTLSTDAPGYRRYVRLWTAIWPLRRICYRLRALINGPVRARLARIAPLHHLYKHLRP